MKHAATGLWRAAVALAAACCDPDTVPCADAQGGPGSGLEPNGNRTQPGRCAALCSANGIPVDPKLLHKYLYAGGDPVDKIDPTGRVYEYLEETNESLAGINAMEEAEFAVREVLDCVAEYIAINGPQWAHTAWDNCYP